MGNNERKQLFETWMNQYKGLFFKFVRAYAFTSADRDDLFQEIALQVWRSIPHFRGDSGTTTWIYRITVNTAIAWTRKERNYHAGKQSLNGIDHLLKETNLKDSRLEWLYEQVARLNKIDRTLMLLLLEGFNYKEMAKILGISESNVGVKINRIKKKLIHQSKKYHHCGV